MAVSSHLQVVGQGLRQCKPVLVNTVGSSGHSQWPSHQTTLTQNFPSHPVVAARNAGASLCVPHLSKADAFLSCNHLGQSGLEQLGAGWISSAIDSKASWLRFKSRRHRYVQKAERTLTTILGKLCLQNYPFIGPVTGCFQGWIRKGGNVLIGEVIW